MDDSFQHPRTHLPVLFLHFLLMLNPVNTHNNHKIVYTQCPNKTQTINPSHPALLSLAFQQLIARSSQSTFSETLVTDDDKSITISCRYQCRNDLSPNECENCVRKFPSLSQSACGENIPSRIQLSGCYFRRLEENADDVTGEILHRACGEREVKEIRFEETKEAAFAELVSGVVSGEGFCDTRYGGVRVVGQCSGFFRACDCGECITNAIRVAGECRFSVSGEVYLDGCFVTYEYQGNGNFKEGNGRGGRSSKLVAIFVGGLALLSLGIALCRFMRSCVKKKEDW